MSTPPTPDELTDLKTKVWSRAFGNQDIQFSDHYYRRINEEINATIKAVGLLRSDLHWHTVRNFFEGHNVPQLSTLDLLATYASGASLMITFHQFTSESLDFLPVTPAYISGRPGKYRIKVTVQLPLVLEIENLPLDAFTQEE